MEIKITQEDFDKHQNEILQQIKADSLGWGINYFELLIWKLEKLFFEEVEE